MYLSWQLGGHKHSEIGKALVRQPVVSKLGVSAHEVKGRARQDNRPKGSKNCGCADKKLKADLTPSWIRLLRDPDG
jgi:hypothetical protein